MHTHPIIDGAFSTDAYTFNEIETAICYDQPLDDAGKRLETLVLNNSLLGWKLTKISLHKMILHEACDGEDKKSYAVLKSQEGKRIKASVLKSQASTG